MYLKKGIFSFKDESYHQYNEEKKSDWIKYPDKLDGGTKRVNISKIKRFVDDVNSGKIDRKKSATDLEYIYDDKNFLDGRSTAEKFKFKKSETFHKIFIVKNIFNDFVYAVFGVRDLKPKFDEDMPPLETEKK